MLQLFFYFANCEPAPAIVTSYRSVKHGWRLNMFNILTLYKELNDLLFILKTWKKKLYVSNINVKLSHEYLPYQSYYTSTNLNKRWDSTVVFYKTQKGRLLHILYFKIKKGCCIFESWTTLSRERKIPQIQIKTEILLPYFFSPKSCSFILNVSYRAWCGHWSIQNIK